MQHDNNFVFRQNGIMWATYVQAFQAWHCRSASFSYIHTERGNGIRLALVRIPEMNEGMRHRAKMSTTTTTHAFSRRCMLHITHMRTFNFPQRKKFTFFSIYCEFRCAPQNPNIYSCILWRARSLHFLKFNRCKSQHLFGIYIAVSVIIGSDFFEFSILLQYRRG